MHSFPARIVILGASGFIGKWLFDRFSLHTDLEVKGLSSDNCDLLSMHNVINALSDITRNDALVMTSAITRLRENTYNSMLKNIQMVENVSKVLVERSAGQFVFLSTVDVYGIDIKRNVKINEKLELNPNDYYAISKIVGEFLLRKTCAKKDIPLTILRLSGVYGPGDKGKSTIAAFIQSVFQDKKIYIYGDGKDMRDFVYVDDIYKIINEAIVKKLSRTINVATGRSYSILQIVDMIKSLSPYEFQVEFRPKVIKGDKRIEDMIFDCSLLIEEFPNLQLTELKEGISRYISHWLKG